MEDLPDGRVVEMLDTCPLNDAGEPIVNLSPEKCWQIGPFRAVDEVAVCRRWRKKAPGSIKNTNEKPLDTIFHHIIIHVKSIADAFFD